MLGKSLRLHVAVLAMATTFAPRSWAGDLKINLPRRSSPTPVQKLNREGVEALRKNHYDKAEQLFYKAYLYDPGDPFTLNNLGYISELQGQIDRAQTFYKLASEQASNAAIDVASAKKLKGKPMKEVVTGMRDTSMQINRSNVEAIRLLSQGRAREAEQLLQQSLALDPKNPFTLNNLGVTKEEQGDLEGALRYYAAVAASHSTEPVIVTLNRSWRGSVVSKMAADSVRKVNERMRESQTPEAQANLLSLRGVAAVNRNDWADADQNFRKAYTLDPNDAFSLNNAGYVAEMEGDKETAQFFYEKALKAEGSDFRVGVATHGFAEGMRLFQVATDNGQKVESVIDQQRAARKRETGPIELKRRDNTPIDEGTPAEQAPQPNAPSPQSNNPPVSPSAQTLPQSPQP